MGASDQDEKRGAGTMPEHPRHEHRRPAPRSLDEVIAPSTVVCSDRSSRPVSAVSTPSATPTDASSQSSERGKCVWRPSGQVPPASHKESSNPVTYNVKFSHQTPSPLPGRRGSSGDTKTTSSSSKPRSSKASAHESQNQFIYRPPAAASAASSSTTGTLSVSSLLPESQSVPSVSTRVKTSASQGQFIEPTENSRSILASHQSTSVPISPPQSSSVVSIWNVRKVRIRCSKCGSKSHLWKECPEDRKCARCSDPENKHPCATVVIRTRMMKDCRDNDDLPQMQNLLSSLKRDGHKPTVHSYSLVLSLLVSKGQMREARKLWKTMDEDGVVADTVCYNTLLNGWCSAGKLEEAKAVLKEMKEKKFQLTTSTYNTLIKGFGLAGQAAEAMKLLQQMTSEDAAKPNKQTYNILINAWAQVKDVDQARRVLQLMRNAGVSPDVVTYNTIAKAYTELRRSFEAERVINEMQDAYIRPNQRTYGIVINSYCETGRPEEGLALLDRMKMDGVRCNLAIYNILIKGFAELYQPEKVDEVLGLMAASGIKPDVQTFSLVMNVWCSSGLVEEARAIFERMQGVYQLRPDVTAYTILAKGYVRARRPAEAEGLLSEMTSQGLKPNVFTYTTVISGWCNTGNMDDAFRIFSSMETCGVRPNTNTVNTLIWGFSESKQPQRAEELLEAMKIAGFEPDRKCLELVAEAWRSVGLPAEARRVLRGKGTADKISDESSLRTRFDSMIAGTEIVLDSNIHKKLNSEPEIGGAESSVTTAVAFNSRRKQRSNDVAAKTRQQSTATVGIHLICPRSKIHAIEVHNMFTWRMEGLKCTALASVRSQAELRVSRSVERKVKACNVAGAFPTRTPFISVISF